MLRSPDHIPATKLKYISQIRQPPKIQVRPPMARKGPIDRSPPDGLEDYYASLAAREAYRSHVMVDYAELKA